MKSTIPPIIIKTSTSWETENSKNILLDTDAVVSIMAYESSEHSTIMSYLLRKNMTLHVIHPVIIELLKSENVVERVKRQTFLNKYRIETLPIIKEQFNLSLDIFTWLAENKYYKASVTDLYLAGTLMKYNKSGLYLLTANISDFPLPLFSREACILLQNNNSSNLLYFLKIAGKELIRQGSKGEPSESPDLIPF